MKLFKSGVIMATLLLVACNDGRKFLDAAIQSKMFIPYELPMPSTRVGTVFRGNSKAMYLVARPEKCFPDLSADQALRWVQATTLPDQYRKVEFGFDVSANPALNMGSETLSLKANIKYVKTVSLEFTGASVEFLEESSFMDYYKNSMSAACKSLVNQYPFVGQGLRVESMRFQFKDEFGGAINLSATLPQIVDIAAGVNWHIENHYTLIIDSPKYIGYRMAKLGSNPKGQTEIFYATSTDKKGNWNFRSVEDPRKSSKASVPMVGKPQIAESLFDLP